ncbi:Uncharacterized protein F1880_009694 [Penicillium rolfsii]|nr:Uncharacterized protein F1880_009694 [Penicillium rolfsii]
MKSLWGSLRCILSGVTIVTAQNLSYGADNFYRSDLVTLQPITFKNQFQMTIAANLFTPKNLTAERSPAIVISHPMGAVKEQSANLYATKLAEQGFVTISIDHAFWGGSDGEPRNAVSPDLYAEDFSAAVDYLGIQSFVDRDRIGALGVCGSGSFLLSAAKIDPRIKAIVTSSMYDMGNSTRNGVLLSQSLDQRKQVIANAARQRWVEAEGGAIQYTSGTVEVLTPDSPPIAREFFDYYRTSRGEYTPPDSSPNLTTHPTLTSNSKFMNFYPLAELDMMIFPRPLLFIAGEQAHSRGFSEDAYNRAAEPKQLILVPGANHVDLYDRVGLIPFPIITQFFQSNFR